MKYFSFALLMLGLALTGAGCGLKQPQSMDTGTNDEVAELREENARLKNENKNLKQNTKDSAEKERVKDDETKDDMTEKDAMKEEVMDVESDEEQAMSGNKVINEITMKADDDSVIILLTAPKGEYKGSDAFMEIGCEDVLVPVRVELDKDMSDLAHAIVQLLVTKRAQYEDKGLSNSISGIGLTLEHVGYDEGKRIIEFAGEPKLSGVCDDARIQAQIEQTIKLYSDNYEIRLNGSVEDWQDLFDLRG